MKCHFTIISIHVIYFFYMIENKIGSKVIFKFFIKFFINIKIITLWKCLLNTNTFFLIKFIILKKKQHIKKIIIVKKKQHNLIRQ